MGKVNYDISRQMQDDLIAAYSKVCDTSWNLKDACTKAVKLPAPRYYVTAKQAYQVIAPMIKGDFGHVDLMLPNRKRMYYSLFEKVVEMTEKRAFIGKSLYYIMQYAVVQPAPEFFIRWDTLAKIRNFIKKGRIDDEGRTVSNQSREKAYENVVKIQFEGENHRHDIGLDLTSLRGTK